MTPNVAAIITQPYNGRSGCIHCGMCSGYGCQVKARSSSAVSLLPIAVASGNCEIRANSLVREISVNDAGRATGVVYFEKKNGNREVFQKAKCVVLSANGTETPRLLLMSKSNRFQQGLANSSGVVGKYLMTGNGGGASALFSDPLNEYKGCVTGAAVLSYVPNDVKGRGWYGGGRMTARGQQSPIQYGLSGPRNAPSWGAGYKKALIEQANRRLTMVNFISQLPVEANMVDLDPEMKDAWGLPALRITTTSHENDFKAMRFFIDKSVEILKAAGANEVWADTVNDSRGGAHARGTCRIGNDPKSSVANKYHRAHDVPNLIHRGWLQPGDGRAQPSHHDHLGPGLSLRRASHQSCKNGQRDDMRLLLTVALICTRQPCPPWLGPRSRDQPVLHMVVPLPAALAEPEAKPGNDLPRTRHQVGQQDRRPENLLKTAKEWNETACPRAGCRCRRQSHSL